MIPYYDMIVIGAGIHGAGAAQATAAAGYSVLLLERNGVASGTSSRSSKLIHGGLRYLETADFRLVREALHERALLLRLAPDLVRLVPFHIPIYKNTRRRPWQIAAGLSIYAVLGGLADDNLFERIPRTRWPTLDGIESRDLEAVFRYYDGQTDDAALTRAVVHSAQSLGAELCMPGEFVGAKPARGGWIVDYRDNGKAMSCTSAAIVNAAGPWANDALIRIAPRPPGLSMELVQGTHIVVETKTNAGAYYVEAADKRAVFVVPWRGKTLVGTTETPYDEDPAQVRPRIEEITYLQQTFRKYFPHADATILQSFAGVRVLPAGGKSLFHRSREVVFKLDNAQLPRLVSIYGGKLTTYRSTAQRVLEILHPGLPPRKPRADTTKLALKPE